MGTFEITRLPLEGALNTRDLGGMPVKGGTIRPHRLIRSGDLFELTERDAEELRDRHGLTAVLDFRTAAERAERPDRVIEGVSYEHIPILEETAIGITREKKADADVFGQILSVLDHGDVKGADAAERYMKSMYETFFSQDRAVKGYRRFFEVLLEQETGSVLWHCTAGKDRAGLATVLLLEALGADRSLILQDYLMVNVFGKQVVDTQSARALEMSGNPEAAELVRGIFSVKESYLTAVYAQIERDHGSMQAFLENCIGLDEKKRARLRELYL